MRVSRQRHHRLRVGLVCPYSFDMPGGVQFHVRDLAESLLERGHEVSVLAPAADDTPLPDYVVAAGRAVPVHYNGSVTRLTSGCAKRLRRDGSMQVRSRHCRWCRGRSGCGRCGPVA